MVSSSRLIAALSIALGLVCSAESQAQNKIVHDAEYYILEAQNGDVWAKNDQQISTKLEAFRSTNNGKAPNIVYILLDDLGFGEIGTPGLSVTRGYSTPNIDRLAREGMSLDRMYTEPTCTPTRIAFMTGRHPVRTGMTEAKVTLAGDGLAAREVTLAEVLRASDYQTSHVGKWHLGDIEEAFPHKQGFDHAEFPIHQQAQLGIIHIDAELADVTRGVDPDRQLQTYTLDRTFVSDPSKMVTGVEARDGKLYEVDLEAGEKWTQQKYREMNERYQRNALAQLRLLAEGDKPFFLNYWPLFPITYVPSDIGEPRTINGGTTAESIVEIDGWIGEIIDEIDRLGIADETIIVVMGDNGPFMQFAGIAGVSDRVYRGGKNDVLEGGVRVNAYVRWPGVIEAGSTAGDIIHVTDLFTTFARFGNALDEIPTDRVIDGVDQTGVLLLGDAHGRRDYVYIYDGPTLKAVVKNKYKMHLAAPGENPIAAPIFDLTRDPREERSVDSIKYGPWAGGQFANMVKRHMGYKQKFPDLPPGIGTPYGGIENLRPETQEILDVFMLGKDKS